MSSAIPKCPQTLPGALSMHSPDALNRFSHSREARDVTVDALLTSEHVSFARACLGLTPLSHLIVMRIILRDERTQGKEHRRALNAEAAVMQQKSKAIEESSRSLREAVEANEAIVAREEGLVATLKAEVAIDSERVAGAKVKLDALERDVAHLGRYCKGQEQIINEKRLKAQKLKDDIAWWDQFNYYAEKASLVGSAVVLVIGYKWVNKII